MSFCDRYKGQFVPVAVAAAAAAPAVAAAAAAPPVAAACKGCKDHAVKLTTQEPLRATAHAGEL